MNIFNSILQKLGLQKPAAAPAKPAVPAAENKPTNTPAPTPSANIGAPAKPATAAYNATPAASATAIAEPESFSISPDPTPAVEHNAMPIVDVVSMLDDLAKSHPGADWKVSIADLLRMLGFEYSYEYRKQLAIELGCPPDQLADSARMNVWLHKTVLQKISENGGNIPSSLLS